MRSGVSRRRPAPKAASTPMCRVCAAFWNRIALQASISLERSLALFREIGDREGERLPLMNLGYSLLRLGRPDRTLEYPHEALALSRETGTFDGGALETLCGIYRKMGRSPMRSTTVIRPCELPGGSVRDSVK
jgi:hypothetical protein